MACCDPDIGVDILLGTGGAPEGVIAAAALRCMGGDFQGILRPRNEEEVARAKKMGVSDMNRIYSLEDLTRGARGLLCHGCQRWPLPQGGQV